MPVSKRTRYEVLRRDGHRCRYCGSGPDTSALTIDHVVPVSLGGSDDPANLVAACKDCNAGKASSNPDAEAVAQVADDAMRWAAAMEKAAENYSAERVRLEADLARFEAEWSRWKAGQSPVPLADGWRSSLTTMRAAGIPMDEAIGLVQVAMESQATPANTFRYFCGCAWKVIRQLQDEARKYVGCVEATPDEARCGHCCNCLYLPDEGCLMAPSTDLENEGCEPCPECGQERCLYGLGYSSGVQQGDHDLFCAISDLRDFFVDLADDPQYMACDAARRFLDAGAELYERGFPMDSLGAFPLPADNFHRIACEIMGPRRYNVRHDLDPEERLDKSAPF